MEILNDRYIRITAVILLAGDYLYLACFFFITVLCHILHTMLSLIAVVLLPALVEAVATLRYDATSSCPGDPLSFTCLAFVTDVLKWNMNSQQIGFRSSSNVADQHSQTIDGYDILANLTSKTCRSEGDCSFGSQLDIVIPDMGNLTLSCQSNNSDSETIVVTVNGEYNTYVHVHIQCTI